MHPPEEFRERVRVAAGADPVRWRRVEGGGYTLAERWITALADGSSVFAKGAVSDDTARWLRIEHNVYLAARGSFLAGLAGFHDDGERPVLLLEDLSAMRWPPPWEPGDVDRVLACLEEVWRSPVPDGLPPAVDACAKWNGRWDKVRDDPDRFLRLGLASREWLDASLPVLTQAADAARVEGDDFIHLDVRSDNLCFANGRAVLVDWNWACVKANRRLDMAGWLPSLEVEGGPKPDEIMPGEGELAAFLSGIWASVAGLPAPHGAPAVRHVQVAQLRSSLPWAIRELGLKPLDGPLG